ncbi:coiled-coil domain-containing protein 17-like [Lepisosteus oculatus]|uniref:coiled-coil domain-containing protein 17-like n=1 Tax=Lepisosteus oculatus TaxID=7918 RepID=UPI0037159730
MTDFFNCSNCNMSFKSALLLGKHKEMFCIGGDIGKTRKTQTPEDMIERVKDYKKRREELRKQHEVRERQLLREMENRTTSSGPEVQEVTHTMKSTSEPTGQSSRALWMHEHDTQVRQLAESHGKHVTEIANKNRVLEKQRKEIDSQLQELSEQTKNMSQVKKMLEELKAQEQKNSLLLETLREQLQFLQMESMRNKTESRHSDSRLYTFKKKESDKTHSHTYIPFYGGGALSSEISALRLTYLQNGGNDQLILAQLHDLLNEALQVEQQGKHIHPSEINSHKREYDSIRRHLNRDLIAVEIENQRLEEDFMKLQMKRRRDPRQLRAPHKYRPGDQKIKALKADIDLLKQQIEIHRLRRKVKPATVQAPEERISLSPLPPLEDVRLQTPALVKHYLEANDLGPAPYDPVAGFVVFYDFLLGLDPFYRICRLVVGLYNGPQEMGNPSSLPPVYCEPTSLSLYHPDNRKGNLAMLAIKQAVPRVRPSPTISLTLELQASGGYDPYGQEVNHLISRGWVKVDIFDTHNRVISGRWKVPIRILPVKPSLTTGEMNGVAQLDNAELFLRIVNARDADLQNSAPISQSNAGLYKYPPLSAARTSFPTEASVPAYHSRPRYPMSHLLHPSYTESVDPSPPTGMPFEELE